MRSPHSGILDIKNSLLTQFLGSSTFISYVTSAEDDNFYPQSWTRINKKMADRKTHVINVIILIQTHIHIHIHIHILSFQFLLLNIINVSTVTSPCLKIRKLYSDPKFNMMPSGRGTTRTASEEGMMSQDGIIVRHIKKDRNDQICASQL